MRNSEIKNQLLTIKTYHRKITCCYVKTSDIEYNWRLNIKIEKSDKKAVSANKHNPFAFLL